jgi:hypothetical protein
MSPKLSQFYGINVWMYWDDHLPPHIHVEYAGFEAAVDFQRGTLLSGKLPHRALSLALQWCELHEIELISAWKDAENKKPLPKLFPLD